MAEHSGFFDAHASVDAQGNVTYDRVYLAESFAKYFASFIGNGVFGGKSNELMVKQKESADMSVKVLSGQGFINGYFYENTDELSLAIDNADGVLNRTDLIVLRWNKHERDIHLAVEKGTPASSQSAPLLKRNDDYYELELAKVTVKAGATKITQADITDSRLDSNVCGFVVAVVDKFDTSEFHAQLRSWIELFKIDSVNLVNEILVTVQQILDASDLSPILSEIQSLKDYFTSLIFRTYDIFSSDEMDQAIEAELYDMDLHSMRHICINDNVGNTVFFGGLTHVTINKVTNDYASIEAVKYHTSGVFKWRRCKYVTWQQWEWDNPPFDVGVEYRTTDRRSGKVVYKRLDTDGVLRYRLEGGSTWTTYAAENNAVDRSGGAMTDDLRISRSIQPSLRLNALQNGAGGIVQMGTNQLLLGSRKVAGDLNNTRMLAIDNGASNPGIEKALILIDKVNGAEVYYDVIHAGNIHLYSAATVATAEVVD